MTYQGTCAVYRQCYLTAGLCPWKYRADDPTYKIFKDARLSHQGHVEGMTDPTLSHVVPTRKLREVTGVATCNHLAGDVAPPRVKALQQCDRDSVAPTPTEVKNTAASPSQCPMPALLINRERQASPVRVHR